MIIYGWRQRQTAQEEISEHCSNCKQPLTLSLHVFHRYAHVFWIPLFPIGKTVKSHCSSCGITMEKKEMPEAVLLSYGNMKKRNRIPIWFFSGLIIIAGLIAWNLISKEWKAHENGVMVSSPAKDDVYVVKSENGYTTYKVKTVNADTVYLLINNYQTTDLSGLSELEGQEYNDTAEVVMKADLKNLFDKGEIVNVERN